MKKKIEKEEKKEPKVLFGPPVTRGEWLELCIKLTKSAISDPPEDFDQSMIEQADRLTKELKEWRKNESKN